ncbi:MAG: DUF998 domain-containing protein [archaeon]|jgi:hypothetical membrane protein
MVNKFIKKIEFDKIKFSGILTLVTFLIFISLAILAYSNYDFFNQNLSELGIEKTGFIFNIGIMLTSIFLLTYFYFKFCKNNNKLFFIIESISCIALFGVGFFQVTNELHYIFAGLFFVTSFLIILIKSISLFKEKKFNLFIFSSLCGISLIVYMFILRIPIFQKLAVFVIIIYYLINSFLE